MADTAYTNGGGSVASAAYVDRSKSTSPVPSYTANATVEQSASPARSGGGGATSRIVKVALVLSPVTELVAPLATSDHSTALLSAWEGSEVGGLEVPDPDIKLDGCRSLTAELVLHLVAVSRRVVRRADSWDGLALVRAAENGRMDAMRLLLEWLEHAPRANIQNRQALTGAACQGRVDAADAQLASAPQGRYRRQRRLEEDLVVVVAVEAADVSAGRRRLPDPKRQSGRRSAGPPGSGRHRPPWIVLIVLIVFILFLLVTLILVVPLILVVLLIIVIIVVLVPFIIVLAIIIVIVRPHLPPGAGWLRRALLDSPHRVHVCVPDTRLPDRRSPEQPGAVDRIVQVLRRACHDTGWCLNAADAVICALGEGAGIDVRMTPRRSRRGRLVAPPSRPVPGADRRLCGARRYRFRQDEPTGRHPSPAAAPPRRRRRCRRRCRWDDVPASACRPHV
eukprot:356922-Chlamydomonas_euryale.AAC.3